MRYPKLRELREAVRAIIKGPYTTRYPFREHVPAERFRGLPEFHEEDCVGCGACANVCPARAIGIKDEGAVRRLTYRWDVCIFCGQCEANCITGKGIILSNKFNLASTEPREHERQEITKELVLCGDCGGALAPKDQLLWVARRLGPLLYSNTSLLNAYFRALPLTCGESLTPEGFEGSDRAKRSEILCPACRRKAVFES